MSGAFCAVASRIASFAPRFVLRASSIAFPASRALNPASIRKIIEIESKLLIRLRCRWETRRLNEVGKK